MYIYIYICFLLFLKLFISIHPLGCVDGCTTVTRSTCSSCACEATRHADAHAPFCITAKRWPEHHLEHLSEKTGILLYLL